MPNRILKETIRTSDTLDHLNEAEEVCFYRLIVTCDDYGRFDGRPAILRAAMYPLRLGTLTDEEVSSRLDGLERAGLIRRYDVDGRPYVQVVNFEKHQQVRAKRSKYPAPPAPDSTGMHVQASDSECPRNPIPLESNPNQSDSRPRGGRFQDAVARAAARGDGQQ